MAASGNLNTNSYGSYGRYLSFSWSRTNVDAVNNTSTISWTLKGAGGTTTSYYYGGPFKVEINNNTVGNKPERIKVYNSTVSILSGTTVIPHNSDGSGSFSVYIEASLYSYDTNISGNGTFFLDTIPRKTDLPNNAISYFGSNRTITINPASNDFTHSLYYSVSGSNSGYSALFTKTASKKLTFDLANNIMSIATNSTYFDVLFKLETYSGNTLIGTSDVKKTRYYIPDNDDFKPSPGTLTLRDTTGKYDEYGVFIKGISRIYASSDGGGGEYGASVTERRIVVNGVEKATVSGGVDFGVLGSSAIAYKHRVKDSRGYWSNYSEGQPLNVSDYFKPIVRSLTAQRNAADPTQIDIQAQYKVSAITAVPNKPKNRYSFSVKIRQTGTNEWTNVGNNISNSVLLSSITIPATVNETVEQTSDGHSYEIQATIIDDVSGTAYIKTVTVPSAFALIGFHSSGTGISFGKIAEHDNCFDVGLPMRLDGQPVADFVIEHGLLNGWQYKKWNSGAVDMWGRFSLTTDFAAGWTPTALFNLSLPFTVYQARYSAITTDPNTFITIAVAGNDNSQIGYKLWKPWSETVEYTYWFDIHIGGFWKN